MRRATIATGLTLALLGATAGSASAATLTPASGDFGKVRVEGESAPKVFTLAKSSAEPTYELEDEGGIAITEDGRGTSHARFQATNGGPHGATQCPVKLTASIPSCQIWVYFTPADPGRVTGTLFVNQYGCLYCSGPMTPTLSAPLSGTGIKKKCKKAKKGAAAAKKKRCKKKK